MLPELSAETWAAIIAGFGGAIVGSIISGTIAFCLQNKAQELAKNERKSREKSKNQVLALALITKLMIMHNNLTRILKHINQSLTKAKGQDQQDEPWRWVQPITSVPHDQTISAEELSLLTLGEKTKLINDILNINEVHNSHLNTFRLYIKLRLELTEILPTFMEDEKNEIGTIEVPPENLKYLRPKMTELNSIISGMKKFLEIDNKESAETLEKATQALHEHPNLGLPFQTIKTNNSEPQG